MYFYLLQFILMLFISEYYVDKNFVWFVFCVIVAVVNFMIFIDAFLEYAIKYIKKVKKSGGL